jgi:hypothetical protein
MIPLNVSERVKGLTERDGLVVNARPGGNEATFERSGIVAWNVAGDPSYQTGRSSSWPQPGFAQFL